MNRTSIPAIDIVKVIFQVRQEVVDGNCKAPAADVQMNTSSLKTVQKLQLRMRLG